MHQQVIVLSARTLITLYVVHFGVLLGLLVYEFAYAPGVMGDRWRSRMAPSGCLYIPLLLAFNFVLLVLYGILGAFLTTDTGWGLQPHLIDFIFTYSVFTMLGVDGLYALLEVLYAVANKPMIAVLNRMAWYLFLAPVAVVVLMVFVAPLLP